MNLEELIREINQVDEGLIIFQKQTLNIDSEIELFDRKENKDAIITKGETKYFYLLEVLIAREFITDWVNSVKRKPTDREIAERLFEYAINDG